MRGEDERLTTYFSFILLSVKILFMLVDAVVVIMLDIVIVLVVVAIVVGELLCWGYWTFHACIRRYHYIIHIRSLGGHPYVYLTVFSVRPDEAMFDLAWRSLSLILKSYSINVNYSYTFII